MLILKKLIIFVAMFSLVACGTPEPASTIIVPPDLSYLIPELQDPPDSSHPFGGGGGRENGWGISFGLVSDGGLEGIFDHYADQLIAHDWEEIQHSTEEGMISAHYEFVDSLGVGTWLGILEITANVDNAEMDYWVEVRAIEP